MFIDLGSSRDGSKKLLCKLKLYISIYTVNYYDFIG
jgi:hypothetical protein